MTRHDMRDQLKNHYHAQSAPPELTRRLAALARASAPYTGSPVGDPRLRRLTSAVYGLAACVAGLLGGTIYFAYQTGHAQQLAIGARQNADEAQLQAVRARQLASQVRDHLARSQAAFVEATPVRFPPTDLEGTPDLVTVKFHIEGCPFATATAPVFAELAEKYGDKPVVFAHYDLTTESSRKRSHNLATCLGIDWVYEGPFQSGMIKVVDRAHHKILATLTDRKQLPELESALVHALP